MRQKLFPRVSKLIAIAATTLAVARVAMLSALADESPAMAGKWQVADFDEAGNFGPHQAENFEGRAVGFEFLDRPDTSFLITDHPAYKNRLFGDQTGKSLVARVVVAVTPGTEFQYWGEPDGSGRAANVRLYFETSMLLGTPQPPPSTQGYSSLWWSFPISVDLADLMDGEATLEVPLEPALWLDCQNVSGDSDDAHRDFFAAAIANIDVVGLSFGGGKFFHNGLGIVPGTGSGSFRLLSYTTE